ncbi:MAG: STAS domain-containing protein [Candidatus Electryonea clarkiae]|nr:STAS domain-containing protein [Candidatus Electryonea clarkiae]MDP8286447.1 STAS domain-containing protein [Candidatus Electryonea clarkiae]
MKVKVNKYEGVLVLELSGKVMGGPDSQTFNNALLENLKDYKKVVLDLGKVKWMNSSGLGIIVGGLTSTKNAGAEMKLARASKKINSLLILTQLVQVFDSHETVEGAIASFGA